jgi:hypothetical protein
MDGLNVTFTKYALAFHTVNHGWCLCGEHGLVTRDPNKATYYSSLLDAISAAHKADELQDQFHQVIPVKTTHEWEWPKERLAKR